MENETLAKLMVEDEDIGPYYRGLYFVSNLKTANEFINQGTKNFLLINTVKPNENSGHFLLIYISENSAFLDSLNETPGWYSKKIDDWLKEVTFHNYDTAPFAVQQESSRICGYYCFVWAKMLAKGKSLNDLFAKFEKNDKQHNDVLIRKLYKVLIKSK